MEPKQFPERDVMKLCGDFLTESELKNSGFKKLGKNVKIHEYANIHGIQNISIGDNVRIDAFAVIIASGEVKIGSYVHIGNFVYLGARHGIVLEDFVALSHGVKIYSNNFDYLGNKLSTPMVPMEYLDGPHGKVTLKKHVIVGSGSVILPNLTIGEGCAVGLLSYVDRSLEPWGIYAGIPVRRIKERKKHMLFLEHQLKMNETAHKICSELEEDPEKELY